MVVILQDYFVAVPVFDNLGDYRLRPDVYVMNFRVLLYFGAILLAGCGFHLRAVQQELPFRTVAVRGESELPRLLRQELEHLAGSRLVATPSEAEATIAILRETLDPKRIIALTRGGKVAEYQLRYTVEFAVYGPDGAQLLAPALLEFRRDFPYDDQQTLAKADEERRLIENMRQQAVETLLRRAGALRTVQAGS